MPNLKGTEASLSYVQCFLYLVSSSICVFFIVHGQIPLDRPRIFDCFGVNCWEDIIKSIGCSVLFKDAVS